MKEDKRSFRERYPGPDGPHLSCLTETTRKGTYSPERQRSIHPRVEGGRQRWPKSHTAKPRKGETL